MDRCMLDKCKLDVSKAKVARKIVKNPPKKSQILAEFENF